MRLLVRLQEMDLALDRHQTGIQKAIKETEALQAAFEAKKKEVEGLKARATEVQLRKRSKEVEVSQKEEAVKKHSMELNQVKTNEAFRALQSEIDQAKGAISNLETDILMCMEELDEEARAEKAAIRELKAQDAKTAADIKVLEDQKADLERKLGEEKASREELTAQVPPELAAQYERTKAGSKKLVVAPVDRDSCGGCRMLLPPQVRVDVTKATEIVRCENCQRILYLPELIAAAT